MSNESILLTVITSPSVVRSLQLNEWPQVEFLGENVRLRSRVRYVARCVQLFRDLHGLFRRQSQLFGAQLFKLL